MEFAAADDVANGGVLLALPALLSEGLLRHTREHYTLPSGYYPLEAIFLFLGLLALARCPSMEQVRYRAESAMAGQLADHLSRQDDLRALLRRLFTTSVNLRPDLQARTLTVEVHRLGSPLQDAAIHQMCILLTETETVFPTTQLRLIYRQVGSS